jgi:hypothetical protein
VPPVRRAILGKPFFDAALPRLAAVRARPEFTDEPNYQYGFEYPLRPGGVLEFLEPMVGYAAVKNEDAQIVAVSRQMKNVDAETSVTIASLVGRKPVLLLTNDGVDAPFLRAISQVPVLMRAWEDHVNWKYIAVNIHDWHYAAGHYHDYLAKDNWRTQHHAWNQEERARRFSMRLIQCPHIDVPALVDTPWHTIKDRYASGGGQNSFWLIDTDGILAHRNGGPFRPLNEVNIMEHALSRLLAAGGRGVLPEQPNRRTMEPVRPTVVIHNAQATAVDAKQRLLKMERHIDGQKTTVECQIPPETRIELDGRVASLGDLKPGDHLQLRCYLDQLGDFSNDDLPQAVVPWEQPKTKTLRDGDREVQIRRVHDGYVADYDLFVLLSDTNPRPVQPRWVRAWRQGVYPAEATSRGSLWPARLRIWRGGRVQQIDTPSRTITVAHWPYDTEALTGWRIVKHYRSKGRQLSLDPLAKERLACVDRWIAEDGRARRYRLDAAVDYTLNGLFDADSPDLKPGDTVTLRYECGYDPEPVIHPDFVRVSRQERG